MINRKRAKVTLELSLMVGILVVIVLAALTMFGNGLREVVANSGFTKHALNKETLANKHDFDKYTATQETIEVAGVRGKIIAGLKRMNAGLDLIGTNKNELSEIQLQEIYKSLLAANMTSSQTMDKLPEDIKSEMIAQNVYNNKVKEAANLYDIKVVSEKKKEVRVVSRQKDVLASATNVQQELDGVQYINAVMISVYGY